MYRKWMTLFFAVCVLFMGFSAKIYGKPNTRITMDEMQNANEQKHRESIAQKTLDFTGRTGQFDLKDVERVAVYYGNVISGNEKEAVVSVKFGPKNTIVAAYTQNGDAYEYIGEVGDFFDVKNIIFVPIKNLDNEIIVVKEYADQTIGAYEESSFFRGYHYRDGNFKMVLNTPEDILTYWNGLWDRADIKKESNWQKVQQKSESKWQTGDNASLNLIRSQRYSVSNDHDSIEIPDRDTFKTENERIVIEKFVWSHEWSHFILYEKKEISTGQNVAVIEEFKQSPYTLTGDNYTKVRILRKDGTYDIVDSSGLTEIEEKKVSSVWHLI